MSNADSVLAHSLSLASLSLQCILVKSLLICSYLCISAFSFSLPLIPPYYVCLVSHTLLRWILNAALSHGGHAKREGGREKTDRGEEGGKKEAKQGRAENWKGKLQRETGTRRVTARHGIWMWEINQERGERGILNHHQPGKYCFEIGHATMQRLLAPNSFCRTLQK